MRFFRSRRFTRYVPLVAAALLCGGIFLFWPANPSEGHSAFAKADAHQIAQGANGDEHPLNGSYLVVPAEEAGDDNKEPVDADLLTALLLVFFGTSLGWLLSYGRGQLSLLYSSGITRRPSFLSARQYTPFLGVFRL